MARLWTLRPAHCAAVICGSIRVWEKKPFVDQGSSVSARVCMCERERENLEERVRLRFCGVCLVLPPLICLAVWPRPEILVRLFWITECDLSAAGKPREIWGKQDGLGIPPQSACPRLWSDPGVRTHAHTHAHTHTAVCLLCLTSKPYKTGVPLTYLLGNGQDPGGRQAPHF